MRKLIIPKTDVKPYDPPLTLAEITKAVVACGSVSKAAELLGRTPQSIYERLRTRQGQEAIRHSRQLVIDRAWRRLIRDINSSDDNVRLKVIDMIFKYSGSIAGLSPHQVVEAEFEGKVGGIVLMPGMMKDVAEWERGAIAYFRDQQPQITDQKWEAQDDDQTQDSEER